MPYSNLQPVDIPTHQWEFPAAWFPRVGDATPDPDGVLRQLQGNKADPPVKWTEEDVVHLHCLLLHDLSALANPRTPLAEKFEILRWVYTDPDKDGLPFSFANCVHVAGCSPLSTFPYFGRLHANDVRDLLQGYVRRWLRETLDRYPAWVRDAIRRDPQWSADQLATAPQWINEQVKSQREQGDLFV